MRSAELAPYPGIVRARWWRAVSAARVFAVAEHRARSTGRPGNLGGFTRRLDMPGVRVVAAAMAGLVVVCSGRAWLCAGQEGRVRTVATIDPLGLRRWWVVIRTVVVAVLTCGVPLLIVDLIADRDHPGNWVAAVVVLAAMAVVSGVVAGPVALLLDRDRKALEALARELRPQAPGGVALVSALASTGDATAMRRALRALRTFAEQRQVALVAMTRDPRLARRYTRLAGFEHAGHHRGHAVLVRRPGGGNNAFPCRSRTRAVRE